MPKPLLLLLVLVVVGGGLFFLLGGDDPTGHADDDGYGIEDPDAYEADPALQARGTEQDAHAAGHGPDGAGDPTQANPDTPAVWLAGRVTDARTGAAIKDAALWVEAARAPCPRAEPAAVEVRLGPGGPTTTQQARTNAEGAFQYVTPRAFASVDLFVRAPGYVGACLCKASGTELDIRLQPEHVISGRVLSPSGHPVEGAVVTTVPAHERPRIPGTVSKDTTTREGMFRLGGLGTESVMVRVDHPHFMPIEVGPREPGDPTPFEIKLVPAYRATFRIRTDDAEPVKNPTVRWTTDGNPPVEGLQILQGTPLGPAGNAGSEIRSETLRIPCSRRTVDFEIKSDGYHPWSVKGEPLPADGGARTYPVTLARDTTVGALRVSLTDKDGKAVPYAASGATLGLTWLGAADQTPTSFVMTASEVLDLPSIQAGPYRVLIRSPKFAPASADVTVVAGELTKLPLKVEAPAKLRLRFVAAQSTKVNFRMLLDGQLALAFPESKETVPATTQPDPQAPLEAKGGQGEEIVLTGLGTGTYTIQITSKHLEPATHSVSLTAGETQDLELEVTLK